MERKSDIDWYRDRLAVIEQEFGLEWLTEQLTPDLMDRREAHPIPSLWHLARVNLNQAQVSGQFNLSIEDTVLYDLASYLERARTLPGYSQAITPAKLRSPSFVKECHVARIAILGLSAGYQVEFVPESTAPGEKSPDLLMRQDQFAFHVEGKKKDRYLCPEERWGEWESLQERLLSLQSVIQSDYEVVVFAVGNLDSDALEEVFRKANRVVRDGEEGDFVGGVPDCALRVRKVEKPPLRPGATFALGIPAWQNPGACVARVVEAPGGGLTLSRAMRAALYVIDAHKISQVLSSYRKARPQLPAGQPGLIYIDVDTSAVPALHQPLYFDTLAAGLLREFRRNRTERVAAVVVTGEIMGIETSPQGDIWMVSRLIRVVRNPYLEWPAGYTIPGEPLTSN